MTVSTLVLEQRDFKTPQRSLKSVKRFESRCETQLQISNFSKICFLLLSEISDVNSCFSWFLDGQNRMDCEFWSVISNGNKFFNFWVNFDMENTIHNNKSILAHKARDLSLGKNQVPKWDFFDVTESRATFGNSSHAQNHFSKICV